MRWLVWTVLVGCSMPMLVHAQSTDAIQGWCDLGSSQALVSGLGSTNRLQGIIPGCLVTVYNTGTQTLATIYADPSGTPLSNPFAATVSTVGSAPGGFWIFWAADGQGYDVVGSCGTPPNNYPQPITLCVNCKVGGGGSSPVSFPCETGLGDGLNPMPSGTYLQSFCFNDSGVTWHITALRCYTDNNGSSTMDATNGAGTDLLTGPITCSNTWAAGMQSATITLASGDYVKFIFAADGTSKQTTWVVSFTK
jgi:hypothetical protein